MGLKMKSMSRILQVLNGLESKAEEDDDTCEKPQANGSKFQISQKDFENFNPNFTNPKLGLGFIIFQFHWQLKHRR